jgi:hypothetical protein
MDIETATGVFGLSSIFSRSKIPRMVFFGFPDCRAISASDSPLLNKSTKVCEIQRLSDPER